MLTYNHNGIKGLGDILLTFLKTPYTYTKKVENIKNNNNNIIYIYIN